MEMRKPTDKQRRIFNKSLGLGLGLGLLTPFTAIASIVTPHQVEGPFYPDKPQADTDLDLSLITGHKEAATGEQLLVQGTVRNLQGEPLPGAIVDVWQANHHGRYSHSGDPNTAPLDPNLQGWGIVKCNDSGQYAFKTIKPGAYPLSFLGAQGMRCRHIHFKVSHTDYQPLTTQMYFDGDQLIEQDPEIAKVPKSQQHLLIAKMTKDEETGLPLYRFDLTLAS